MVVKYAFLKFWGEVLLLLYCYVYLYSYVFYWKQIILLSQ